MDEGPLSYDKHVAQQRLRDWERRKSMKNTEDDQDSDNGIGFFIGVAIVLRIALVVAAVMLAVFAVMAVWNS